MKGLIEMKIKIKKHLFMPKFYYGAYKITSFFYFNKTRKCNKLK